MLVYNIIITINYEQTGTLLTDEGSWSPAVAEALGKDHLLCSKHKQGNIMEHNDVSGPARNDYFVDMSRLIFGRQTVAQLEEDFVTFRDKYNEFPKAVKFLKNLEMQKKVVCRPCTEQFFSFGKTASSHGEGSNSRIKGRNELKSWLSRADLVTSHEHVRRITRDQDLESLNELQTLRKKNFRWSKYYHDSITKTSNKAADSAATITSSSADLYNVEFTDGTLKGRDCEVNLATPIVHRGNKYVIPTCSCGDWSSTFKLCPCIIKVLSHAQRQVFTIVNIHPIYHLNRHPLWAKALVGLGVSDYLDWPGPGHSSPNTKVTSESSTNREAVPAELYDSVRYNKKQSINVTKLRTQLKTIESLGLRDESRWRLTMARLKQLAQELEAEGEGRADPPTCTGLKDFLVSAPPTNGNKKRAKLSKEELENKSHLARKRQKTASAGTKGGLRKSGLKTKALAKASPKESAMLPCNQCTSDGTKPSHCQVDSSDSDDDNVVLSSLHKKQASPNPNVEKFNVSPIVEAVPNISALLTDGDREMRELFKEFVSPNDKDESKFAFKFPGAEVTFQSARTLLHDPPHPTRNLERGTLPQQIRSHVINYFVRQLREKARIDFNRSNGEQGLSYFCETELWLSLLRNNPCARVGVDDTPGGKPLLEMEYIYIPIALHHHHKLVRIDTGAKVAMVYDSADSNYLDDGSRKEIEDLVNFWLEAIHGKAKKGSKKLKVKVLHCKTHQQTGKVDCGVFTIIRMITLYLSNNPNVFKQRNIGHCRDRLMVAMMNDIIREE